MPQGKIKQSELSPVVNMNMTVSCAKLATQTHKKTSEIFMHFHPQNENNFQIITSTEYTRTAEARIMKDNLRKIKNLINNKKNLLNFDCV